MGWKQVTVTTGRMVPSTEELHERVYTYLSSEPSTTSLLSNSCRGRVRGTDTINMHISTCI